jgi:hypothetical protein
MYPVQKLSELLVCSSKMIMLEGRLQVMLQEQSGEATLSCVWTRPVVTK